MRILRDETVGLIIDVQERLFPHIDEHPRVEDDMNILIKGLKALKVPMLVTEQYTKGLGFTIPSIKENLGNEYSPIEKTEFSCYDNKNFAEMLEVLGKKNIIIAGIESHVCVMQTCLDLLANGYTPIVIEDCVGSREHNDKICALARIEKAGGIISTYESILFELCRVSGTAEFKVISGLVK